MADIFGDAIQDALLTLLVYVLVFLVIGFMKGIGSKGRRILLGVVVLAGVLHIGGPFVVGYVLHEQDYRAAQQLVESGQYAEAEKAFSALGFYRNSEVYEEYCQGQLYLEKGDYKNASGSFSNPMRDGLLDSEQLYCYAEGHEKMLEEDYEWAYYNFKKIPQFRDSDALRDKAKAEFDRRSFVRRADEVCPFSEGFAAVKKNDQWGYINTRGEIISPLQWHEAKSFSEGLAAVKVDGKWGYINTSGETVIEPAWDAAEGFSEGLAAVKKDGKWGYINACGEIVSEPRWDSADSFFDGFAAVSRDGREGYINPAGEIAIPLEWDHTFAFGSGLGLVERDGKYGFIDACGEIVIDLEWDDAYPFTEGLAVVARKGEYDLRYGYINPKGEIAIDLQLDQALPFSEGLAAVGIENLIPLDTYSWGYINTDGEIVIDAEFDSAGFFSGGIASVVADFSYEKRGAGRLVDDGNGNSYRLSETGWSSSWGCINTEGEFVIHSIPDYVIRDSAKHGLFTSAAFTAMATGEPMHAEPVVFSEGLAAVRNNDGWFIIDTELNIVI